MPSWIQRPTLFIHIPKTGGTTLDAIFRDHFFNTALVPSTPFELFGQHIGKLNDPAYRYIGGHYPISTIDASRFEDKVTVLRDPLDSLCSGISYINKLRGRPPEAPIEAETNGLPALTYKKFFTTHFDTERYLLDLGYNLAQGMRNYLFDCAASDAVENIKRFTHVFDFEHFDGEVKRFLIEREYFPYAEIGKKRQYSYQPDYARARRLLSEFDEKFHRLSTPLLKKVPDNIDSAYEQYREDYCRNHGLALRIHEGRSLDLRMPLGSGWHHVERSENDTPFRWSEPDSATVEIPLALAGRYAVYLYIHPASVSDVQFSISTRMYPVDVKPALKRRGDMLICEFIVDTRCHEWLHIAMHMAHHTDVIPKSGSVDDRERGVILGNVYVCRHPQ